MLLMRNAARQSISRRRCAIYAVYVFTYKYDMSLVALAPFAGFMCVMQTNTREYLLMVMTLMMFYVCVCGVSASGVCGWQMPCGLS